MKINSIRFKASILYTSILCIILVCFSGVLYGVTRHILYRDVDDKLKIKASEVVNILHSYEKLKQTEFLRQHLTNKRFKNEDRTRLIIDDLWRSDMKTLNLKSDYINIFDTKGQSVIKFQNFDKDVMVLFQKKFPLSLNTIEFKNINNSNHRLRAINLPFLYGNKHRLVIQIGTPLNSVLRILNQLLIFIGGCILFILSLTSFVGSFLPDGY